ncbi:MAG: multidrug effflux MFS transporter [Desulfovibrio sp.]
MPQFLFITLLAAFPALSTDMYLPALPTIQTQMAATPAVANLSLVLFFALFSVFLLVFGPLADKYGRRPILLGGITVYILGSIFCAISQDITQLIIARMLQASGAASAAALSMTLAKDLYTGQDRQKILAYIGVIIPICPMIAPSIGQIIIQYTSWQWIFICQTILATCALYGSIRFKEPVFEKATGSIIELFKLYPVVLKNYRFTTYCFSFAFMGIGFFGYIAASADIFINTFTTSGQTYALLFGLNACGFMAGSFFCSVIGNRWAPSGILSFSLFGVALGSLLILLTGGSIEGFTSSMLLMTFSLGVSRPISNNMILEAVNSNIGTAAALLTFTYFVMGAIAMEIVSLHWTSRINALGILGIAAGIVPLIALFAMRTKRK